MSRALRPGQARALALWAEALRGGSRSELVVVPVGYGKTVIGVGSFEVAANLAGADTCLYLTPTDVLRTQVYDGIERALGLVGSPRPIRKLLAENSTLQRVHGTGANFIVASYQQVMAGARKYEALCRKRRVHLVADEAHHIGERGRWAEAIGTLPVVSTLLLSATPVRLDREAIAGARYEADADGYRVIAPLLEVSMRDAWKERRILKRLNIQMKDYAVQLRSADGQVLEFTASEMAELPDFDQRCVRQELRWNEDYVQPLIREFAATLNAKIASCPGQHQGLVFAATTEHANHLARLLGQWHPELRAVVVHSGDIADAENEKRMKAFHAGKADVLIQVKKASEGFDAPAVSVLLKLDAVFSREPVIQQVGRGLRHNSQLPESQNLLHLFVGRDPRLSGIIEHLERDASYAPVAPRPGEPAVEANDADEDTGPADPLDEAGRPEIIDIVEAGDAFLDQTGQYVDGQQLSFFGVPTATVSAAAVGTASPGVEVIDLQAELRTSIEYCRTWTNRAARARAGRVGPLENHHAALNLAYARETGRKGALNAPEEYVAKGDWMKRQYSALMG